MAQNSLNREGIKGSLGVSRVVAETVRRAEDTVQANRERPASSSMNPQADNDNTGWQMSDAVFERAQRRSQ